MAKTSLFIVTDDRMQAEKASGIGREQGWEVQSFSTQEWSVKMENGEALPSLTAGAQPVTQEGAKILQFRQPTATKEDAGQVRTINELESIAIENAIHEFNGNLTEAAKALGIGRATLYRKVKQYNIDPSQARRKKVMAA